MIHLLRASFRYGSNDDRKKIAAQLRPIYTAATTDAAEAAMAEFEAGLGQKYPAIVRLWRDTWETFIPFLAYPSEIRRVVYTSWIGDRTPCGLSAVGFPIPSHRTGRARSRASGSPRVFVGQG